MAVALGNLTGLEAIFDDIRDDIDKSGAGALRAAASLVPVMIRSNILAEGTRAPGKGYPRLSLGALRLRKTFPHGASRSAVQSYIDNHIPLIDTGALFDSFTTVEHGPTETGYYEDVSSQLAYGPDHEFGLDVTPRSHMYLADEDVPVLDEQFAEGMDND